MSTTQNLNAEVISVLCNNVQETDVLLANLQAQYPNTAWTLNLLNSVLEVGKKQGRYLRLTRNPDRWQIRYNMALINTVNHVYVPLCNRITRLPDGPCGPG
jgi:hypothetical protein